MTYPRPFTAFLNAETNSARALRPILNEGEQSCAISFRTFVTILPKKEKKKNRKCHRI